METVPNGKDMTQGPEAGQVYTLRQPFRDSRVKIPTGSWLKVTQGFKLLQSLGWLESLDSPTHSPRGLL